MRVLVLGPAIYDTSPGQRFRIEQWARYLEREGVTFVHEPFEDEELHEFLYQPGHLSRKAALLVRALSHRFRLLARVNQFDIVYLFREGALAGPALFERLLAWRGVPVIYDFDDAVWVPYISPSNKYLSYLKCFGKTATLCRLSQHVVAGNAYLADYAQRYNSHVSIVPTTIDTEIYRVRPADSGGANGIATVGWTGSYSTVQHLDLLRPALAKLRQRLPFRLSVIGTSTYQLEGLEVLAQPWRAATEVSDLQQFDVGIMPLPDDAWSRGKCGLKLLQCMALGLPVIGSPVGVNREIIQDGVNGFLATTDDEWVAKLARLIENPALRREMGARGRQLVEERYSAEVWAPRVRALLESVAGRGLGEPLLRAAE